MTFTKLDQNLQRKQRDRFWLQSRVNTTIFQVMQIIWTFGSFCVGAPLVMSSETLDFRRRAQSALSQESPSKATRVSSFEFMGKTECKLINRHIESALTWRPTVHIQRAKSHPIYRLHIVLNHAVAYEKIEVCNWLCWLRALDFIRSPFWFLRLFFQPLDPIMFGLTCDTKISQSRSLNCQIVRFKCSCNLSVVL